MSLHYILDGYNVIKKSPFLNKANLKDSRDSLLLFIKEYLPCGSKNNSVTVVFDGKSDIFSAQSHDASIEIIYTSGESADSWIKRTVEKSSNPRRITVVTEDREIKSSVRSFGAQVLTIAEFVSKAKPKHTTSQRPPTSIDLNAHQVAEINAELEKLWLKEK